MPAMGSDDELEAVKHICRELAARMRELQDETGAGSAAEVMALTTLLGYAINTSAAPADRGPLTDLCIEKLRKIALPN